MQKSNKKLPAFSATQSFLLAAFFAVSVVSFFSAHSAHAQTAPQPPITAGTVNRDIQKDLPGLGQYNSGTSTLEEPAEPGEGKKKKRFIQDPTRDLPEQELLAAPITRIVLITPLLKPEISAILQDSAFNHHDIGTKDLERVRQQIWKMGLEKKRLLHVHFRVVPQPEATADSWLIVEVTEIVVRDVIVEAIGDVREAVLNDIKKEASREFYVDKVLDLDELDARIKSRLRLGDVLLHTSVEPVDETHVDLKVMVKPIPAQEPTAILRYDNSGGWSFGRDRLLGGVSAYGLGLAGDKLDILGMKTADVSNGDYGNGTYYGRAEYQVPVGEWGVRLDTWASGLHYHTVNSVPSNSYANGEALEIGQGAIKPVYTGPSTLIDMRADYYFKYTVDRVFETLRTDEKNEHNVRLKGTLTQAFADTQMLQVNLGVTEGYISLDADKGSYNADQLGPHVDGAFTKFEGDAQWSGAISDDTRTDFHLGMQGQAAANNLDTMEQFALGGVNGLRAFGSGEAPGDNGVMLNGDVGYQMGWGLRPYVLYDVGSVWKTTNPWTGQPNPNSYVLQDVGAGIAGSYGPIDVSLVFAHQIGGNPGQTAQGLDIDNTKQHYRVWSAMTYRF